MKQITDDRIQIPKTKHQNLILHATTVDSKFISLYLLSHQIKWITYRIRLQYIKIQFRMT